MTNPLLEIQFEIPFDQIEASHVEPAADELIASAKAGIAKVVAREGTRTYDNTIGALDRATEPLEFAVSVVGHLESTATTEALRAAYNAIQPKVAAFYAAIPLDPELWSALRAYAQTDDAKGLDPTRARHLEKLIDDFKRHGAELPDEGKRRLEQLGVELSELTTKFAQNVLDSTNDWELIVDDEAKLAGLPEAARQAAAQDANANDKEGWRFSLHEPSFIPLLTYLDDADLRRQAWSAYNTRATRGDHDNRELLQEIVRLRNEKAALLGYKDFADLVLEDRMAKTGANAGAFIERLRTKSDEAFGRENEELLAFRRELEGPDAPTLQPWDVGYYSEKQRRKQLDFDAEALRPYFPLPSVLEGMFALVGKLYGVEIEADPSIVRWHEDVSAYRVRDPDGTALGAFYVDAHPRASKRGGAWMNGLITGVLEHERLSPHLGLICANLTPPIGDAPALLTHREVETLFHEFGHLMHHLLSRVSVRALGGTNVAWDFVELPSQIMENWCWEPEALNLFAKHYETGTPIPDELFAGLLRTRTFRAANAMMRQLGFATVDLELHTHYDPARDGDVISYSRSILEKFAAAPLPDDYGMIAGFLHLFAHPVGYAAAYYSYKWAEVLDADAFGRFKQEGIFSREVGTAFRREILACGDSRDPAELYKAFMGRAPDVEPLLRRCGLVS